MAKRVSGYVRSKEDGSGIPGINVLILDETNSQAIPAGGVYGADANPVVTDVNGYFEWESELSPGPLKVEADIPAGAEVKIRSGRETMQVGDVFLSDLSDMLKHWSFGVVKEDLVVDPLKVTPVTGQRQVRVKAGLANMRGYVYRLDADRIIDIDANATLTNRIDLVVLEQHVGGDTKGRQGLTVIPGTVNGVAPSTNADPDVFQFPVGTVTVPLNATSVTVADSRIFSAPVNLAIPDNSVGSPQIVDGSIGLDDLSTSTKTYIDNAFPGITAYDYLNSVSTPITNVSNPTNTAYKRLYFAGPTQASAGSAGNLVLGLRTKGITTGYLDDDSVTGAKIADNAVNSEHYVDRSVDAAHINSNVFPVIMKGRNDTNQDFSNTSTILSLGQSIASGSYVWFAIGVARITGIPYQGNLLSGWLTIEMNGGEQGAEAFYMPGWVDDGSSVQVLANGTFASTGSTPTFTLRTKVDGGGTLRVNQRQLLVFMMKTG